MRENVNPDLIWVTGNTVIDALLQVVRKMKTDKNYGSNAERGLKRNEGMMLIAYWMGKKMVHYNRAYDERILVIVLFVYLRQLKN